MNFQAGSVLHGAPRFWEVQPQARFDDSQRLVAEGTPMYRFVWRLHYRNGTVRRQYERCGDALLQTLFVKLPKTGVHEIQVFDARPHYPQRVLTIGVPEGAEAEVCMTCHFDTDGSGVIKRIYTFGWMAPNGQADFFHLDPERPKQAVRNNRRIA